MQPSDTSEPQVVLLCGISGSGKTHYALGLQAEGYRRLSADEIAWAEHGRDLVTMPLDRQRQVFMRASRELLRQLEQALRDGDRVVVDSTLCSRDKRDAMRGLCRRFGVEPRLVYMQATKEVLRRRLGARRGLGADDQPVPADRLDTFCRGFQAPPPTSIPSSYPSHKLTEGPSLLLRSRGVAPRALAAPKASINPFDSSYLHYLFPLPS